MENSFFAGTGFCEELHEQQQEKQQNSSSVKVGNENLKKP
mgnify:CR=1 FL=1